MILESVFIRAWELIKRIHDHTSKHQCHHCGKHFNNSTKLNVHFRRASNEVGFAWKCQYCQKEFNNTAMLKDRINAKQEQSERHQCDKCTYSTWYRKNISNHIRLVHLNIKTLVHFLTFFRNVNKLCE